MYDAFLRPGDGDSTTVNGTYDWQSKEKNPNLLLQQQYFLLHQHQQHQQQLMNSAPDGSIAKMHLDKYMKLTNRYLDTMSPFFQHFTPLMSQSPAGQPSTSVQAAATAAATLLLTSNLNNQHASNDECETPPERCPASQMRAPEVTCSARTVFDISSTSSLSTTSSSNCNNSIR